MKASKDSLGTRMKENYENRTRYLLPRRTNIIIRIDGKAFHSYTKGLDRPIDQGLTDDMNETTKYLCENIQGAKFGYVQSDEISILITDYEDITTDGWFDNNLQKMCSISASMATAKFNELRLKRNLKIMEDLRRPDELFLNWDRQKLATFDSRVFVIPETEEVINYFIWRQQDATRNSVSMAAQSMFSHKELHDKSSSQMQDMMMTKNVNWNDYPIGFKRGRCVIKKSDILEKLEEVKRQKNAFVKIQEWENAAMMRVKEKELLSTIDTMTVRKKWTIVDPPIFTQDRGFITFKNSKEDEYVTKCIQDSMIIKSDPAEFENLFKSFDELTTLITETAENLASQFSNKRKIQLTELSIADIPFFDKRVKMLPCMKALCLKLYSEGVSVSILSKRFKVCMSTVYQIVNPEALRKHKEIMAKRVQKRKPESKGFDKAHRAHKKKIFKEILK